MEMFLVLSVVQLVLIFLSLMFMGHMCKVSNTTLSKHLKDLELGAITFFIVLVGLIPVLGMVFVMMYFTFAIIEMMDEIGYCKKIEKRLSNSFKVNR